MCPRIEMSVSHGRAMQGMLTEILRTGQERGELTGSVPAESMTEQLLIVARSVIFDWCLHSGEPDLLAEMREILGRQSQSCLASQRNP